MRILRLLEKRASGSDYHKPTVSISFIAFTAVFGAVGLVGYGVLLSWLIEEYNKFPKPYRPPTRQHR